MFVTRIRSPSKQLAVDHSALTLSVAITVPDSPPAARTTLTYLSYCWHPDFRAVEGWISRDSTHINRLQMAPFVASLAACRPLPQHYPSPDVRPVIDKALRRSDPVETL